jgi:hypothetical protein
VPTNFLDRYLEWWARFALPTVFFESLKDVDGRDKPGHDEQ